MNEPQFDAVFWDIGGVILRLESVQQSHHAFVTALLEAYDSPHSPEKALETWRSTLGAYFRETAGTNYRPARDGYRRAVDAILSSDVEDVDWQPLFEQVYAEYAEPNPDAIEAIERLADTAVHLGIISDVDHEEGQQILENFGVLGAFDSFTSSEAVGRKKPDPAMFETALEKAGVEASNAVMIGDRYSHDMQGGRDTGMTTIAYGADDGPAVDYRIDDLREVLSIVGLDV